MEIEKWHRSEKEDRRKRRQKEKKTEGKEDRRKRRQKEKKTLYFGIVSIERVKNAQNIYDPIEGIYYFFIELKGILLLLLLLL